MQLIPRRLRCVGWLTALVTALLSSAIVSPRSARVVAIHTPYISALYIVCGLAIRALMRILPLTTPVPARS